MLAIGEERRNDQRARRDCDVLLPPAGGFRSNVADRLRPCDETRAIGRKLANAGVAAHDCDETRARSIPQCPQF
jgi:hypothetical protein